MKYKVHPELKSLSANLKRLEMGFIFFLPDFKLVLEENNLDEFWESAEALRRKAESSLYLDPDINYTKYSDTFIIGLDIILRQFYNNKIEYEFAEKYFTRFFSLCFKYFIENNNESKDYTKLIEILEQNDFINKDELLIIKKIITIKEEELKNKPFEIIEKTPEKKTLENKNLNFNKKYQIFISSTYIDLKEERQAAVESILKKGHIPAGMELFTAGSKSQWEVIKKWIDDSDIYLLILGGRYGSIDKTTGLSYTEMEYNYAIEKGKPFFALSLSDDIIDKKPVEIIKDYDLKNPKYISFREKIKTKMCSFPNNLDQIKTEINHSLDNLISENKEKMKGWIKGTI